MTGRVATDAVAGLVSDEDWLKVPEVAVTIRMGPDWVRRQCAAGVLPAKKFGKEWRIQRGALRRWATGDQTEKPAQGGRAKTARQKRRDTT